MPNEIITSDLNQIWIKWDRYDNPSDVMDKAWKHAEKLNNKISEMFSMLGKFDNTTANALGEKLGEIVARSMLLCYFIGYELASGQMIQASASLYLTKATEPIDDFIGNILEILVRKEIVSQEIGREMALELAKLTGGAANNICVLGIANFKKIGNKTKQKKPWLAALLNCFPLIMGLGYIYLGNWGRFGVIICVQLFSLAPMTWLGLRDLNPLLLLGVWIFSIFDGYSQGKTYNNKVSVF